MFSTNDNVFGNVLYESRKGSANDKRISRIDMIAVSD